MSFVSHRNIIPRSIYMYRTGKKNVSKRKIFWDEIMFFWGIYIENCVSDYFLLLSTSDVVDGPSKISFNAGAMIFRDACVLRCL